MTAARRGRPLLLATVGAVLLFPAFGAPLAGAAAAPPAPGNETVAVIDPRLIKVKFRDETRVAVAGAKLAFENADAHRRLSTLLGADKAKVTPLFPATPEALDAQRAQLTAKGKNVPDLTTWVQVQLDDTVDPTETIAKLKADPLVEHAYVVPKAKVTGLTATQQSNLTTRAAQYLGTGASGLNILAQASVPGALGDNIDLADLEFGSNLAHEDLLRSPATIDHFWAPYGPYEVNHGTMVAGTIAAKRDGIGADGVAPNTRVHLASAYADTLPAPGGTTGAIYAASQRLAPGSVLIVELAGNGALEVSDPADGDAFRTATAAGVIVVEAAGNDADDYDSAEWAGSSLAPGGNDTGAIVVGAGAVGGCASPWGTYPARTRVSFSSSGSRVDVQGPGHCVSAPSSDFSGNLYGEYGTSANNGYTYNFAGTSSATAVIGGFVSALSGAYEKKVGVPLTPALARATLRNAAYGKAQDKSVDPRNIGPLPDLGLAIAAIVKSDTTAPSQPSAISWANMGTKISIGWSASSDAVGVTHYDIYRNGSPYEQSTTTSYFDRKTVPGTSYTYTVYAIDAAGNRSTASSATLVAAAGTAPTDTIAPSAAASLTPVLDATTPNAKVNMSWAPATDNAGSIPVYQVRRNGVLIGTASGTTTYSDTTVKPGTYYRYSIVALDNAGNRGTPSKPAGIVTGGPKSDRIAPVLPGNPVGFASGRTVTTTWTAATDAVGVTSYDVYRAQGAGSFTLLDQTSVPSFVDTLMASNTAYTYRVYAVDAAGNRSSARQVTLTSPTFAASTDTTTPVMAGSTGVALSSANKPMVAWAPASDNVGIAQYQVRKNGLYAGSTGGFSMMDNGSTPGRYATYGVIAIDAAGNRSPQTAGKGIAPTP